ncbi:MAG: hypothetical protein IKP64_08955 [Selenomonadaceae bacterium]|nr:hypothetical protein [Selenomonadaceae bacterium]
MKKIFVIGFIVLVFLTTPVSAHKWDFLVDMPPNSTYYIESSTVYCDSLSNDEIVFHAFLKSVFTAEGRKNRLQNWINEFGYIPDGGAEISYSVFLEYFKWNKGVKYYAIDSETVCRSDGSVVHDMSYSRSWHNWKIVNPGAISDTLFNAVFLVLYERTR